METENPKDPDWDRLFEIAAAQEGHFTTRQAVDAGYSPQLLAHHVRGRKLIRLRRGIYRLVHFPAGEQEEFVMVWLWSEQQGVFSHQTALALHDLSDVLPSHLHLTLPAAWRRRRLRTPPGVRLHYADIAAADQRWFGVVPITSPSRTLIDCAAAHFSPELLQQALDQALTRGIVSKVDVVEAQRSLDLFGEATPRDTPYIRHR